MPKIVLLGQAITLHQGLKETVERLLFEMTVAFFRVLIDGFIRLVDLLDASIKVLLDDVVNIKLKLLIVVFEDPINDRHANLLVLCMLVD